MCVCVGGGGGGGVNVMCELYMSPILHEVTWLHSRFSQRQVSFPHRFLLAAVEKEQLWSKFL